MSRLRPCIAVLAIALAVAWCRTAVPASDSVATLLGDRTDFLVPLASVLVPLAWGCGMCVRTSVGVACAFLALSWLSWSVVVRCALDASPLLDAIRAAAHERVWLTAAGIAAVAIATHRDEQTRERSATFRRPLP